MPRGQMEHGEWPPGIMLRGRPAGGGVGGSGVGGGDGGSCSAAAAAAEADVVSRLWVKEEEMESPDEGFGSSTARGDSSPGLCSLQCTLWARREKNTE